MKITIRKKALKDNRDSLFLDCHYPNAEKKRVKNYLKLYTFTNPKSSKDREHNKKTMLLAESIRSKILLEEQHKEHNLTSLIKKESSPNFISYFKTETKKRFNSTGNYGNWDSVLKHLIKYKGENVLFSEVDSLWLEGF